METIDRIEEMEKNVCSLPLIFSEMFKDEVNAVDEQRLYRGVLRVLKKYSDQKEAIDAINEFTRAIAGGASMEEILNIAHDEAVSPSLASALVVDETCKLDEKH
ncbi:MAG: hypothetical protein N2484_00345 [Clostridia bacterium]|nr:hypothetical protein [Clostridia bacterium]